MVNLKWRHILPLFYILITAGYCIIVFIIIKNIPDIVPLIPGNTSFDLLILFFGVPLLMCFLLLFMKIIAMINFKIMSKLQINYEYYYVEMGGREIATTTFFNRALVPVFMAIALSLLINGIPYFSRFFGPDPIAGIIFGSLLLSPLTFFLFIPIWVFQDSGIIRIRKKAEQRRPPKIIFFGSFQYQSYRGFAGITTPIMYFITIYGALSLSRNIVQTVITFVILLYPLFLMGIFMPALLIYERKIKKFKDKILKKLKLSKLTQEVVEKNIF
ncbi:MAG: hypothetical protein ACTSR8_20470 [Promethearchaeota archaeon]